MLFCERRRKLDEYSSDCGDHAGFGVVGSYVGDVLDEVVQRVQVGGGGGPEGYKVVALLLKPNLGLFGLWAGDEFCCHTQGLPPVT